MHLLDSNRLVDCLLDVPLDFSHSVHRCSYHTLNIITPCKDYLAESALFWRIHQTRIGVFPKFAQIKLLFLLQGRFLFLLACFWRQNELVIKEIDRVLLLRYDWLEARWSFLFVLISSIFSSVFFVLVFAYGICVDDNKIKLFSVFVVFKFSRHLNWFASVSLWVEYANSANLRVFLFLWRLWFLLRLD